MKKRLLIVGFLLFLFVLAVLVFCLSGRLEKGSEAVVQGVVIDQAMGKVREEDFRARSYISLEKEDGTVELFWFSRALERRDRLSALLNDGRGVQDAKLGDTVAIKTAIEAATGLRVVTGFLE